MISKIFTTIIFYIFLLGILNANTSFYEEGVNLYKDKKFSEAKFKFEQDIVFNPKSEKSYLYLSKIFKNGKIEFPINIENHMIEKLVEGTRNEPPFMMYT